jgi:hypothetical protein
MTITLTAETEALLRRKVEREGGDLNAIADALLAEVLRWEAQEAAETLEGIQRGLEASDTGRVQPFAAFAERMRTRYSLPTHLSDEELMTAG